MKQTKLFESEQPPKWVEEWQGMPEFVQQQSEKPYAQITIRFSNENDLQEFAKIIGQKLTKNTKSIWHPAIERGINANKLYINESKISRLHNK